MAHNSISYILILDLSVLKMTKAPFVTVQSIKYGYQLSAISYQLSVISYQLSVISYQLSVWVVYQRGLLASMASIVAVIARTR